MEALAAQVWQAIERHEARVLAFVPAAHRAHLLPALLALRRGAGWPEDVVAS